MKVIAGFPQSLGLSIEENLKPTVQCFLDIGLSQAQVVKVIATHPQVLGYSIEENLKPTVQWFLDIGLSQPQVVKAIATHPQALGYSIEENLKPKQALLEDAFGRSVAATLISKDPRIFSYSYQRLDTRLTVLVERNLLPSAMRLTEAKFARRFLHEPK